MNKQWIAVRNLAMVTKLLLLVAVVAIVLALGTLAWLGREFPLPSDPTLRATYLEQYVGLVQVIAVGIVVTLLSVIIPMTLPEARDRFERYKESRQAYSRAKTAVIYLPDKVSSLDREKAFLLVEDAHRELHLAETFQDVIIGKGYLKWFANPGLWISYNYWQIFAVAEVLRNVDWNASKNRDRLSGQLQNTLDVVHGCFGKWGEKLAEVKWDPKNGSRWREVEDELERHILESASGGRLGNAKSKVVRKRSGS